MLKKTPQHRRSTPEVRKRPAGRPHAEQTTSGKLTKRPSPVLTPEAHAPSGGAPTQPLPGWFAKEDDGIEWFAKDDDSIEDETGENICWLCGRRTGMSRPLSALLEVPMHPACERQHAKILHTMDLPAAAAFTTLALQAPAGWRRRVLRDLPPGETAEQAASSRTRT